MNGILFNGYGDKADEDGDKADEDASWEAIFGDRGRAKTVGTKVQTSQSFNGSLYVFGSGYKLIQCPAVSLITFRHPGPG